MTKTWFITGTSKGFGRVWAESALARGDKVVATARKTESVRELTDKYPDTVLTLALDVTDHDAVKQAVATAKERFGRIDVAINNAGYGLMGAVEEVSEQQARDQIETNVFGALWVTQAVLPIMREQESGHIIQVSSIGGATAFPGFGLYNASKWALEGFSQSLSLEVARFGINVTLVEPGPFGTDWSGPSAVHTEPLSVYQSIRDARAERYKVQSSGDPRATGPVMLGLVDMDNPPLRILFGKGTNEMLHREYQKRLDEWDAHKELSEQAHGQ